MCFCLNLQPLHAQEPETPADTTSGPRTYEVTKTQSFGADDDDEDDNTKTSQMIDAPIEYKAADSVVLLGNGTAFLHGQGNVN